MDDASRYCLYCCEPRGRSGGCRACGPDAPGRNPEVLPRALRPGTVLADQYLLGRVLGAGGFGITYLGVDLRLRQRIAVKEYMPRAVATRDPETLTVQPDTAADREAFAFGLQKFLDEARLLAKLFDHPNVVSVLTSFDANGTGYLVMRYLEGRSLDVLRRERGGRLPEAEAVPIVLAALDGLRAVHGLGMLHRDIKPGNVYVTTDGQVKLLDFGAARYASSARSKSLTAVLTPPYAPFEQYYDSGAAQGPWTDVYSAGVLLYVLLTGKHPPEAPARLEEDDAYVPAADVPGVEISQRVSDAIDAALRPRAKDRPQDAAAFQALLLPPRRSRDEEETAEEERRQRLAEEERRIAAERERLAEEQQRIAAERRAWEAERSEEAETAPDGGGGRRRRLAALVAVAVLAAALSLAFAFGGGAGRRADAMTIAVTRLVAAQHAAETERQAEALRKAEEARRKAEEEARRKAEEEAREKAEAEDRRRAGIRARLQQADVPDDHPAIRSGAVYEEDGLVHVGEGGDVATIQAGVDRVREGGLVVVLPGVYPAGAKVETSVHVIGGGSSRDAVRIESKEADGFWWKAAGGSLQRLTVRHRAAGYYGIDIDGGSPIIADNDLSSPGGSAVVTVRGAAANPTIRGNEIHDGKQSGIFVYDKGRGTIEDNDVHSNSYAAIEIKTGGDPVVRRNRIHDGKSAGVYVHSNGRGTIEDNDIFGNQGAGIEIKEGGAPLVRRNKIHDSQQSGIYVRDGGRGTIEDNEIFGNRLSGVSIKTGADPVVRGNEIHGGQQAGVFVYEEGRGTIEANDIHGNRRAGIGIKEQGSPIVRGNKIRDGKDSGIYVYEGGRGTIENNEIFGNADSGIYISEGGAPVVKGNTIRDNAPYGIYIKRDGKGTIEGNTLQGNRRGELHAASGHEATLKDNAPGRD